MESQPLQRTDRNMRSEIVVLLLFCCSPTAFCSFFQVSYPNVNLSSEAGGNLIFEAGYNGNIFLKPGNGGSVYLGDVDLRKFVQKVKSLPPVWSIRSVHATLGTFYSGQQLSVSVEALDPDGGNVTYNLISGHLPPGTSLNQSTGIILGTAPDVDATYSFGIRATDPHGKYADGMFSIDIRERNQCASNPCLNGGNCTDDIGAFRCTCPTGYGNRSCEIECRLNSFGVGDALKMIPNAQMSGHLTIENSEPWNGRLGSSNGWIGNGTESWLQVDLGETRQVYAVAVQGYHDATYHIDTYRLSHSTDGNNFFDAIDPYGHSRAFKGSTTMDFINKQDLTYPVKARFVRFVPITWRPHGQPGLRVEIYGCPMIA